MYSRYSNVRPDYEHVRAGKTPDNEVYGCQVDILSEVEGENKKIAVYKVIFNVLDNQNKSSVEFFDLKAKGSSIVRAAISEIRKINFVGENDTEDDGTYKGIKRNCNTCEFNFGNICAGKYYGMEIGKAEIKVKESNSCDDWGISLKDFSNWRNEIKKTRLINLDK